MCRGSPGWRIAARSTLWGALCCLWSCYGAHWRRKQRSCSQWTRYRAGGTGGKNTQNKREIVTWMAELLGRLDYWSGFPTVQSLTRYLHEQRKASRYLIKGTISNFHWKRFPHELPCARLQNVNEQVSLRKANDVHWRGKILTANLLLILLIY